VKLNNKACDARTIFIDAETSKSDIQNFLEIKHNIFFTLVSPVTDRGGPYGFETSRLQHFLDHRLTNGDEVVDRPRRPSFTPRKISATHLC
jgi:hypothetical protein